MTATTYKNGDVIFAATPNGTKDSTLIGGRTIPDKKNPGAQHKVLLFEDGAEVVVPSSYSVNFDLTYGLRMAAYWEENKLHLEVL